MSLLIWFPFINDTSNQGLLELPPFSYNGFVKTDNGKLGSYYKNRGIVSFEEDFLDNIWSIACWVMATSWSSTIQALIVKNNATSSDDQIYLGIVNGSSLRLYINGTGYTYNYSFSVGVWYHCSATYDGSNYAMYLNGEKVKFGTSTSDKRTGALKLCIGCRSNNAAGTATTAVNSDMGFNDVRIYDHALSEKEVKELSKGLMLHYKLGGPGGENIVPNSNGFVPSGYRVSNFTTTTNVTVDEFGCSNAVRCTGSDGTNGIVSLIGGASLGPGESGVYYSYSIYVKNNHSTNKIRFNSNNGGVYSEYLNPGKAKRLIAENAIGNGTGLLQFNIRTENVGDAFDFTVWHPKIEVGSKVTPWCPKSSDTEYSTMGYDDNIEYDLSGYKNNGIKTAIIGWSGDTPRYNSSYKFDGTNYISMSSFLSTTSIYSKITISFWIKRTADFGDYNPFIYSGIMNIYVNHNYNNRYPYTLMCSWNHAKEDLTYSTNTWLPIHHVPLNEWEHIVFTFDSGVITLFINGELINSNDRSSTGIYIYGRRGTTIGNSCDSIQLSDLRVYATALSEEDIKELYSVSASIDNVGNLYSAEVVEG